MLKNSLLIKRFGEIVILVFILIGLISTCIMIEELVHLLQGKGGRAICIGQNLYLSDDVQRGYLVAFTNFDDYPSITEFNEFRRYTEKYVKVIEMFLFPILFFEIGLITGMLLEAK